MKSYKLLTPGPLTTTETVKKEMMFDHCTWDDDYKQISSTTVRGTMITNRSHRRSGKGFLSLPMSPRRNIQRCSCRAAAASVWSQC